jgi:hypothetical protein
MVSFSQYRLLLKIVTSRRITSGQLGKILARNSVAVISPGPFEPAITEPHQGLAATLEKHPPEITGDLNWAADVNRSGESSKKTTTRYKARLTVGCVVSSAQNLGKRNTDLRRIRRL